MLTVAISKRNKLQNIIVLTPKDGENFVGCAFYSRCPYAAEQCKKETPVLQKFGEGHKAACHRATEF